MTALAAVGALTLAACSGDGGGSGSGGELTWEDSPLNAVWAEVFGAEEFNEEQWQAEWAEQSRQIEELIAACMAQEGFEYIPVDQTQGTVFSSGDEDVYADYGTAEWAAQYGYGMTTMDELYEPVAEGEEWFDPNQAIVQAMSASEQAAYYSALWGDQEWAEEYDEDGNYIEQTYDPSQAGCYGAAEVEVYGDLYGGGENDPYNDPQFASLVEEMDALYARVEEDPRVSGLDNAWASCMADAGHAGFSAAHDAEDSLWAEYDEIWNAVDWSEIEQAWEDGVPEADIVYPEPDPEAIAALREREIALATADYTCREEVGYEQTRLEVQFELEQEFVDNNREALEAFVQAMSELQ